MAADKSMISAQMDTTLIRQLNSYAKANGLNRSAALRRAIEQLLDSERKGA